MRSKAGPVRRAPPFFYTNSIKKIKIRRKLKKQEKQKAKIKNINVFK